MAREFLKKIVVAVNGSESSMHAAMYGIMMARSYGLKMKAVYVVDTATIKYLSMNKFLIAEEKLDYENRLTEDGQKYLKYVEKLAQTKGLKIETSLLSGGIYSELVKECDKYDADILLLGGHENPGGNIHRSSFSEAEKHILTSAHVPVMVVQKPEIEKIFKVF